MVDVGSVDEFWIMLLWAGGFVRGAWEAVKYLDWQIRVWCSKGTLYSRQDRLFIYEQVIQPRQETFDMKCTPGNGSASISTCQTNL